MPTTSQAGAFGDALGFSSSNSSGSSSSSSSNRSLGGIFGEAGEAAAPAGCGLARPAFLAVIWSLFGVTVRALYSQRKW